MMRPLEHCALVLLALIAGFSAGCGVGLETPTETEPPADAPPPLLDILAPHADLRYGDADDVDPQTPGLQLDVVVRVFDRENGVVLRELSLFDVAETQLSTADVVPDKTGRVARFSAVTVVEAGARLLMRTLVVRPTDGTPGSARVRFRASSQKTVAPCETDAVLIGGLFIDDETPPPQLTARCGEVQGDLVIDTTDMETLPDLGFIAQVTGDVVITKNPKLTSLDGLSALRAVEGDLSIVDNPALPTTSEALALIERLSDVGGEVRIDGNGPG